MDLEPAEYILEVPISTQTRGQEYLPRKTLEICPFFDRLLLVMACVLVLKGNTV